MPWLLLTLAVVAVLPFWRSWHKLRLQSRQQLQQLQQTQRQLEQEHHAAAQWQQWLLHLPDGIIILDAKLQPQFCNAAATELLQLKSPLQNDKPFIEQWRHSALFSLLENPKLPHSQEMTFYHGQQTQTLLVQASRLTSTPGGILLTFKDISQQRHLLQVRQEFVANASHELKTPLTVIKGYLESLLDVDASDVDTRQRFLKQTLTQVNHLAALVDDLLTLTTLEAKNSQPLQLESIDLVPLIEAMLLRLQPLVMQKSLRLDFKPQAKQHHLHSNRQALEEILGNLLDNAIKYTPAGGSITLNLSTAANHTVVQIDDTGQGISGADLPRIFERFYRADKARSPATVGTGLGLAIVKHRLQQLRGDIEVTSTLGRGSSFIIRLPDASHL